MNGRLDKVAMTNKLMQLKGIAQGQMIISIEPLMY